jgi:phospho-N-acetylmuramoyl-pentapeptide-transferase
LLVPGAFLVALVWGPAWIGFLVRNRVGKQIRVDGPAGHLVKAGTPTIGGWIFILPTVLLALLVDRGPGTILLVAAMLAYGAFGTFDDYTNLRSSEGYGMQVRWKLLFHLGASLLLAWLVYAWYGQWRLYVPWVGAVDIGWWFVPLGALAIYGTVSSALIDGLDGLAGGVTAMAYAAYLAIALGMGLGGLAGFLAAALGGVLGFLWFNVHPARVFMGDAGALALTASLALAALMSGHVLLLPVIGVVFVAEVLSVALQVTSFKLRHGKRIFRMTPLHHHFELGGWPEVQIVLRFWLVAAVAAALGVALALTSLT